MNFISAKDNDVVINLDHVIYFELCESDMICFWFNNEDATGKTWTFDTRESRDAAYAKLRIQVSITEPINKKDMAWALKNHGAVFIDPTKQYLIRKEEK